MYCVCAALCRSWWADSERVSTQRAAGFSSLSALISFSFLLTGLDLLGLKETLMLETAFFFYCIALSFCAVCGTHPGRRRKDSPPVIMLFPCPTCRKDVELGERGLADCLRNLTLERIVERSLSLFLSLSLSLTRKHTPTEFLFFLTRATLKVNSSNCAVQCRNVVLLVLNTWDVLNLHVFIGTSPKRLIAHRVRGPMKSLQAEQNEVEKRRSWVFPSSKEHVWLTRN